MANPQPVTTKTTTQTVHKSPGKHVIVQKVEPVVKPAPVRAASAVASAPGKAAGAASVPATATSPVVLPIMVAFVIFLLAGPGAQNALSNSIRNVSPGQARQPAAPNQTWLSVNAAVGWGATFLILMVMSDIPVTNRLATGLAWLIFLSVILSVGPAAADNVTNFQKSNVSKGVGAGATGKPATTTQTGTGVGVGATGHA